MISNSSYLNFMFKMDDFCFKTFQFYIQTIQGYLTFRCSMLQNKQ